VVPRFEQDVAARVGGKQAVAVNSATSALHIACLALGLGPGDWLWTSPITFLASANCALYCGARVDFVDVEPHSANLCPRALEAKLQRAQREGRLPRIVVPVHLGGEPCDMKAIHALAQRYGFKVIEDASHAIGGAYDGEPVGNCRYSDICIFSFHPVKIITTGEGGMALTNNASVAEALAILRNHGMTRDPARMTRAPDGPWYYQQIALGFNYRMTDLQAALGASQLTRLESYVARRHALADRYDRLLAGVPLTLPARLPGSRSALHLYVIRLRTQEIRRSRREVFDLLRAEGIGVNVHYIPVHLQPHYAAMGFRSGDYPEAERYYEEAISLPMYAALRDEEQDQVVAAVRKALA
jgi:UDP-4-amino-4,6-dideoxy-N-acetyl-beta-L-altrosamine transaminase